MPKEDYSAFWDWVDRERERLHVTWHEFEGRAGVGNAVLVARFNKKLRPTLENMIAIARVLSLPLGEVLRQAGYISSNEEREPTLQEIIEMSRMLTVAERRNLLRYIRFQYGGRAAQDTE